MNNAGFQKRKVPVPSGTQRGMQSSGGRIVPRPQLAFSASFHQAYTPELHSLDRLTNRDYVGRYCTRQLFLKTLRVVKA